MEALAVDALPAGAGWQYEPKWDGFRGLLYRDGAALALQSKSGQSLARYFPELIEAAAALRARRFVLDGEIAVPQGAGLSFDQLLARIHPAASRVKRLAAEHPALFIVFDLLADERGRSLLALPLQERRKRLEVFAAAHLAGRPAFALSPATRSARTARAWFLAPRQALDGVMAKRLELPYASGERRAMQKVKQRRTADCVVGGFRYGQGSRIVGSLLLGLHDDEGLLHHVGFTSSLSAEERRRLTPKLEKLVAPPGFTGRAPGGPSRWSTARSAEWRPLRPKLVVEVEYNQVSELRFRHGSRFLRWRPDKSPAQCTLEQIRRAPGSIRGLLGQASASPPRDAKVRRAGAKVRRAGAHVGRGGAAPRTVSAPARRRAPR